LRKRGRIATVSDAPVHPANRSFRIGDWLVQPSLNTVSRGETVLRVRPKVMDVLVLLAEHAGEVLSKDAIIDVVWAKKFLADTALSRAIFELREALGDDAHRPRYIETVPKRGYRLVAPVTPVAEPEGTDGRPEKVAPRTPSWWPAVAVGSFILVAVSVWVLFWMRPSGPQPPRAAKTRRIAVLPFEDLGAPKGDCLTAGLTAEITGRLAAVQGLAIISQTTAQRYTKVGKGAKEIGRELGVDYLVEGGIQWDRANGVRTRVRFTPRLVRTADATQVWAGVYDTDLQDVFKVQSEIARRVVEGVGLTVAEPTRLGLAERPTANVEAYEAYLRGLAHWTMDLRSEQGLRLALEAFERSATIDPAFALAHAEVAKVRSMLYHRGFERTESNRREAGKAIDRALLLAKDSPRVHLALGLYRYLCFRDYPSALEEVERARTGLGDTPEVVYYEGAMLRRMGRWDEALTWLRRLLELSPRDWAALFDLGDSLMLTRRYAEADQVFRRVISLAPDECEAYGYRALNLLLWKGAVAEARQALEPMPASRQGWPTVYWFHQETCEGRYEAAVERARNATFGAAENSVMWRPRALLLAQGYRFLGRSDAASAAFDEARAAANSTLSSQPDDFRVYAALGLALAGLGRKAQAISAGRRAIELCPMTRDALSGSWAMLDLAQIYATVGEPQSACALLDTLLSVPSHISVPLLEVDPTWTSLRGQPCLAALVASHKP
jgi:DNA-binding winged helix-turn-helix (wHTH) protein/TolB-like protein/tetratricopeptide (TPR) repeat protein